MDPKETHSKCTITVKPVNRFLGKHARAALLIAALAASLLTSAHAGTNGYTLIDLGPSSFGASAINDAGQVVGYAVTEDESQTFTFLWDRQRGRRNLHEPACASLIHGATDINAVGQVTGGNQTSFAFCALLWDEANGWTELGTGGTSAINDMGQVVGSVNTFVFPVGGTQSGFIWDKVNGRHVLEGIALALGINNAGQVVGQGNTNFTAILWDPANGLINLGALPGDDRSVARDISEHGQVVGSSSWEPDTVNGRITAFVWSEGVMTPLTLPGFERTAAYAVNDAGQVVGTAFNGLQPPGFAALWEDGVMINLNDLVDSSSGWVLKWARDINNRGEIVGQATLNGLNRGFLLTKELWIPPLTVRTQGNEILLNWIEGPVRVSLQFCNTISADAEWTDLLDMADRSPGEIIEYSQPMQGAKGFFRLVPLSSSPAVAAK